MNPDVYLRVLGEAGLSRIWEDFLTWPVTLKAEGEQHYPTVWMAQQNAECAVVVWICFQNAHSSGLCRHLFPANTWTLKFYIEISYIRAAGMIQWLNAYLEYLGHRDKSPVVQLQKENKLTINRLEMSTKTDCIESKIYCHTGVME